MANVPAITQSELHEDEANEDLAEILEQYINKPSEQKPFLVKNGIKVIL